MARLGADSLLDSNVINEDNYEVYIYGFEVMLIGIAKVTGFIVMGLLLKILPELILFILCIGFIRSFAGGIHSKTALECFIITLIISCTGIYMCMNFELFTSFGYVFLCAIISTSVILMRAPMDTEERPCFSEEYARFKLYSILITILYILIALIIYSFMPDYRLYGAIVMTALLVEAISLLPIYCEKEKER